MGVRRANKQHTTRPLGVAVTTARCTIAINAVHRAEDQAEQRAWNQAFRLRALAWLGKDKSWVDLARFAGIDSKKFAVVIAKITNGSHERHDLCYVVAEKLP